MKVKVNESSQNERQAKFLAAVISELRQIADDLESGQKRLDGVDITAGITDITEPGDSYRNWKATSHRQYIVKYCDATEAVPESALDQHFWSGKQGR